MRLAWACAIVAGSGCGPTAGVGDEGSETSAASTADASETSSAVDSSGGTVVECSDYATDPSIGPAVTVTVRNASAAPVFFDPVGCGGSLALAIVDAAGGQVQHLLDGECSPNTCDGFVSALDCSVGCNDCAPPQAGRIEAGGMGDATWSGRTLTALDLDPACVAGPDCPATCVRPDAAPAGTYTVGLVIYRTCVGTCECDPPTGVCGLWNGDEVLADPEMVTVTIDYPTQTTAELVIVD